MGKWDKFLDGEDTSSTGETPTGKWDEFLDAPASEPVISKPIAKAVPAANPIKSLAKNVGGAVLEPVLQMGTGYISSALGNIGGLTATATDFLSGGDDPSYPQQFKEDIQDRLTYQPKTEGGKFVSENILAPIGGLIQKGADYIGTGVKDLTGSDMASNAAREAAIQGVGLIGVKGGATGSASLKAANLAKVKELSDLKALQQATNSIMTKGKEIGLIAPSTGGIKEVVSKLGGANPHLSVKNTETATKVLAKSVGMKEGAISDAALNSRIGELVNDYKVVQKALPDEVPINSKFLTNVENLLLPMKEKFLQDPQAFAGYSGAIKLLEQQLKQQKITPSILMDKIQKLRSDARTYSKNPSGKPIEMDLAETSYKLANVYEDLIENTLGNKTAILEKFRNSRKQLSQIHIIDEARMPNEMIDLRKLSSVVGKYGASKRLVTGDLKTIVDFANTFKDVTRPINKANFEVPSRWELLMAGGGIGAAVPTSGASLMFTAPTAARLIVPSMAERGMLQSALPDYGLSATRQIAPPALQGLLTGSAMTPYLTDETK